MVGDDAGVVGGGVLPQGGDGQGGGELVESPHRHLLRLDQRRPVPQPAEGEGGLALPARTHQLETLASPELQLAGQRRQLRGHWNEKTTMSFLGGWIEYGALVNFSTRFIFIIFILRERGGDYN